VILLEVIEHLSNEHLDQAFAEIKRLLKPGGRLILSTPNREDLAGLARMCPDCGSVFHVWQHIRSWAPDQLTAYIEAFNLSEWKIIETNLVDRTLWHKLGNFARKALGRTIAKPHLVAIYEKL
jgi:2-polyprenyl-3-methyl-5-hydroxy-6-metoxy-1,4-benzoquinol methylase